MPVALGVIASQRTVTATPGPPTSGLQLWLDADDASTFTYSSGVLISEWRDKSAGVHHAAQSSTANQPSRNATMNGRTAVYCAGDGRRMDWPTAFAIGYTAAEIFITLQMIADNSVALLWQWSSNAEQGHYTFGGTIYENWGHTDRPALGDPAPNLFNPHIYNVRTAAGSYVAEINGGPLYSSAVNTVNFDDGGYKYKLPHNTFNANIAEVIMYDRVVNAAERGQIETYLSTKWGVTLS